MKARLRPILDRLFTYKEEASGHTAKGRRCRLDFWCYPKAATIAQGWPERWFGIEAKGHELQDQRKKSACRLLYQAIMYRQSTFPTPAGDANPDFVLVHPSFAGLLNTPELCETIGETFSHGYALALAKEAGMWRVGELLLSPAGEFEVYFHGINRWFSSRWGRAKIDCLGAEDDRRVYSPASR